MSIYDEFIGLDEDTIKKILFERKKGICDLCHEPITGNCYLSKHLNTLGRLQYCYQIRCKKCKDIILMT